MKYYLWINGEQSGPISPNQIEKIWKAGEATFGALYWHEGMPQAEPLKRLFEGSKEMAPTHRKVPKIYADPLAMFLILSFAIYTGAGIYMVFTGDVLAGLFSLSVGIGHSWWSDRYWQRKRLKNPIQPTLQLVATR